MSLTKDMEKALNAQVNKEFESEYIYLSMHAYFESQNFLGFATWMKLQAEEERKHAMKIFEYIARRGGRVLLEPIAKPKVEWKSALEAFEDAYKHEQFITDSINSLKTKAQAEKDHATDEFLNWYVSEQVEEEEQSAQIVAKIKMAGDSKQGLLILDHRLGKREKEEKQ